VGKLRDLYTHHQHNNQVEFTLEHQGEKVWFAILGGPKLGLWLVEYKVNGKAVTVDWDDYNRTDPANWTECIALVCAVFTKLTGIDAQAVLIEKHFDVEICLENKA